MAICEFCGKEVPEEETYLYEMTCPNGAVYSHDICPDCVSAIVGTVNKVRSEHFLKWVTIHRPQTYNELLREYHDFCKNNPEKANTL